MDKQQPAKSSIRYKRYRQKKKERIGEEAYREYERQRKKQQRANRKANNPVAYAAALERDRVRKQVKKEEVPPSQEKANFSTKQALFRSVKKAKGALPKETPKKVEVLSTVLNSLSPSSKGRVFTNARRSLVHGRRGRPSFDKFQQNWLINFLKRPNISYTCPGRRDAVCIGKDDDGKKLYHPKHYLLWYLKEVVPLIAQEITESLPEDQWFEVSYGSLRRFIKTLKYIRYKDDMVETTCTCDLCENLELLLVAVNQPNIETDGSKLMQQVTCDPFSEACSFETCNECSAGNEVFLDLVSSVRERDEVAYYQWVSGEKYPQKVLKCGTGGEVADELTARIRAYKRHNYSRFRQHQELNALKASVVDPGSTDVIVQVDFSENYTNVQKNEIQSAYFGHQCFSLYTVCIWYGETASNECMLRCKSFCIISDSLSHDKTSALHFNRLLIDKIRQIKPDVGSIHFWSDGCAAQFKSKFCFYFLAHCYPSDLHITWSFFESHHGKGPVDGIGGKVKSSVYSDVKAGQVVIQNAEQFAAHANVRVNKIDTLFVPASEIINSQPQIPEKVPDVPGTRMVHFVERVINDINKPVVLNFYRQSQFESNDKDIPFRSQVYRTGDEVNDHDVPGTSGISSPPNEIDWVVGDWVKVVYDDEVFPGEVINLVDNHSQVQVMVKSGGFWKWPDVPDILWYTKENVIGKLPAPIPVGNRGQYKCIMESEN